MLARLGYLADRVGTVGQLADPAGTEAQQLRAIAEAVTTQTVTPVLTELGQNANPTLAANTLRGISITVASGTVVVTVGANTPFTLSATAPGLNYWEPNTYGNLIDEAIVLQVANAGGESVFLTEVRA